MDDSTLVAIGSGIGIAAKAGFDWLARGRQIVADERQARGDRITALEARVDEMVRREDKAQEAAFKLRMELQEVKRDLKEATERAIVLQARVEELTNENQSLRNHVQAIVLHQDEGKP